MNNAKVSVCIAVYNVEKYIEQCVRSLFEQTLDDLEYVFVDDASPDASIDVMLRVLEEYPHRKNQVKLIRHEHNQGVAVTRKDAIAAATGEYIIHCDPDDWVELDMYEKLYKKAVENNADMVYCGYVFENNNTQTFMREKINKNKNILENFFFGNMTYGLWNKLYKSQIVQAEKIKYDDTLTTAEDWCAILQYLQDVKIADSVDCGLYHYRIDNINSLCKKNNYLVALDAIDFARNSVFPGRFESHFILHEARLLLLAFSYDALPAAVWRERSKNVKPIFWKMKYPLKLKGLFYFVCINYSFARCSWIIIKSAKKFLTKILY